MIDFIIRLLDRWFKLREPHRNFLSRALPEKLNPAYCLGGMAFTAFLLSAATGLLLSIYYVPSGKEAYQSIVMLHNRIWLGWLVQSVHKWSANLLIVFTLLHAARVFIHKAYRPPRELNWMAGALGFVLIMVSGFTGYLLPWDQRAYWATVVGTGMAGKTPGAGGFLVRLLRGGPEVGSATLLRFYSLHTLWVPFMLLMIFWAHFHMVKRQGISGGM
ncbi:MAG: cytochrome b N-terminal domain-containing protein [Nitrospiraceae bacterium]|nr:cytochrome b N-terminal domain-containing protein [Nitrospiraceae bacterium]MDA8327177.1 cytochrome b N-terminal domain-containing protein [Nitrospiraceae bacterium]